MFLALLATALISAIQYFSSLIPALSLGRWQPPVCGLLVAALVITTASQYPAPPSLKVVLLPLFFGSLVSTLVMRERDWESVLADPAFKPHPVQWILISLFAVISLVVCVLSGIGKPILIALGQDVVGVMHSEKVEIAVAGGCAGFLGGLLLGAIVASMLRSSRGSAS
jgi:membrane associated rhomboid family serine protease